MAAIAVRGIEKVFPGGALALAGIDLEVRANELLVLLGPSGCGKSTLLRILAGIEQPTRGRVFLGEEDVTDIPAQRRDVAMVFQNYALYPHMSVRENLGFGVRMRGADRKTVAERVAEVADLLGLEPLLERKPAQLSGGQRQRVALGRAIARRPRAFLLDEPLSNLDAQLRVSTRTEVSRLQRTLGTPMVYVTHDQEEAMTLGDRIAVLRAGRLLQIGPPLEIYTRPATAFVAEFVGSPSMNLLPATIRSENGSTRLVVLGRALDRVDLDGARGASLRLGIRPEDVLITNSDGGDLRARVEVVEPLGRETLLHVSVEEDSGSSGMTSIRALVRPEEGRVRGDSVGLQLRRDRLHLFDATDESRLL